MICRSTEHDIYYAAVQSVPVALDDWSTPVPTLISRSSSLIVTGLFRQSTGGVCAFRKRRLNSRFRVDFHGRVFDRVAAPCYVRAVDVKLFNRIHFRIIRIVRIYRYSPVTRSVLYVFLEFVSAA